MIVEPRTFLLYFAWLERHNVTNVLSSNKIFPLRFSWHFKDFRVPDSKWPQYIWQLAARWGDYDSCGFPETKRACGGSVVPEFSIGFSYQLSLLGFSIVNLYQCSQLKFNCSSLGFSTRLFCPFSLLGLYTWCSTRVQLQRIGHTILHCTALTFHYGFNWSSTLRSLQY